MIQPTIYYEVLCDRCGERLEDDVNCAWIDEENAMAALTTYGWIMRGKRVICDNCKLEEELEEEE